MFIRAKSLFLMIMLTLFAVSTPSFAVDEATSTLIEREIEKHKYEIINIRRFVHMNPELSNREFETSKLVASKLLSMGLEIQTGVAKTGVTGLIRGDQPGITVALRADMDALPIQEETRVPYKSLNDGIMHACGHDVHTTIVLGTALVLNKFKNEIKGNIKFIFQPAEEGTPSGEDGGASLMVREGVLDDPPVRTIFGLHVWPEIEVGEVMFSPGPVLASADNFTITLKGKSSHGARPHEGIDAIVLAAQTVMAIQSIVSRMLDPTDPAVVSIGKIEGGLRANIIADEVHLEGTARTLSQENRIKIERLLENTVRGITRPIGADYAYTYRKGAPPVYNHPELAAIMFPTLIHLLGESKVRNLPPQMVADDFSEFCQKIPGFYLFLGVRSPNQETMPPLHNPLFNPDERSIAIGIKICCHLLLDCLGHQILFEGNTR
jgi:amidohydrolase